MTQEQMELARSRAPDDIARLKRKLQAERSQSTSVRKQAQKERRKFWAYAGTQDVYDALKHDAQSDAQNPFDEHFRECLYGLRAIAAEPGNCTCKARGWHGDTHDTQCPIWIAEDACGRAITALGEGLKAKKPCYESVKGGPA